LIENEAVPKLQFLEQQLMKNDTAKNSFCQAAYSQGIGVSFLIPENYREIQEFNHKPHQRHEIFIRYL
jgi:hypothetical protein